MTVICCRTWIHRSLMTAAALICCSALVAQSPQSAKPSQYAPAADLLGQVDEFVEQMGRDLANEADYGEYQQERIRKDANTVAALALVLGKHDQPNAVKPVAPAVIAAAVELAENVEDHGEAKAAFARLRETLQSGKAGDKPGEELAWEPVADLQQLMKQVPIVNNSLRRGVTGRRFERAQDKNAGLAAALAAIAQASMVDTTYCADEEAAARWAQICADMRNACAEVNQAVRGGDQQKATAALDAVVKTCDACHHEFR